MEGGGKNHAQGPLKVVGGATHVGPRLFFKPGRGKEMAGGWEKQRFTQR